MVLTPNTASARQCREGHLPADPLRVRLIRVELESGEVEVLITSLLDTKAYPYRAFAKLYALRWGIEENYKRDKRVFDLVKDFGTSESPKSTRSSTTHWCPGRPGHPAFRHNIASSLRLHTGLPYDWTPRSDAPLGSPLAPSARRVSRVASRLPGTTRLRFALHGGQRKQRLEIENFSGRSPWVLLQDFHAKIFAQNLTAIFVRLAQWLADARYQHRRHGYRINFANALSKMKNNLVRLFLETSPLDLSWRLLQRMADAVVAVRPGRKFPRDMKKVRVPGFQMQYRRTR